MTTYETRATADVADELGDDAAVCELEFRHFGKRTCFAGPIATVCCREDNALVAEILRSEGEGRALVVDGGGSLRSALLGDRLASAAFANGWSGVVINGAIRDIAALREIAIGVRALGASPRRSSKNGSGNVDVPVRLGGVLFTPGAMLHCDEDGLAVVLRGTDR
jgi:regulator of ribonuclease activity A